MVFGFIAFLLLKNLVPTVYQVFFNVDKIQYLSAEPIGLQILNTSNKNLVLQHIAC